MRYFYQDANLGRLGPCTMEELRRLYFSGVVKPDTLILPEGSETGVVFKELWSQFVAANSQGASIPPPATPPPLPNPSQAEAESESFARRAGDDLRTMLPHLALPLEELKTFRWLDNRKALAIAGIGLLPLIIYAAFGGGTQIGNAFWPWRSTFPCSGHCSFTSFSLRRKPGSASPASASLPRALSPSASCCKCIRCGH
jgi:hypothetical protein